MVQCTLYIDVLYLLEKGLKLSFLFFSRPKRIPYFGDSGHLMQRALEASLARHHAPVSVGQQTPPDTLPHVSPDNGSSSYTLIR